MIRAVAPSDGRVPVAHLYEILRLASNPLAKATRCALPFSKATEVRKDYVALHIRLLHRHNIHRPLFPKPSPLPEVNSPTMVHPLRRRI